MYELYMEDSFGCTTRRYNTSEELSDILSAEVESCKDTFGEDNYLIYADGDTLTIENCTTGESVFWEKGLDFDY